MELLQAGKRYKFGCFGGTTFKVLATHKSEAWIYWIEDRKTTIEFVVKDELAELIND